MKSFLKYFLIVFVVVIVASLISPPPMPTEWLIGECVAAAALAVPLISRLDALLNPPSEEFEFEIVTDEEYKELSQ